MFDWLKENQEITPNDMKVLIDDCGDKLDLALNFYYKKSFMDKNLKNNKTGIERFYLFMCFGFGYLHGDLNKLGSDEKIQDYFVRYIPIRLIRKLNTKIATEVFKGFDISLNNIEGIGGAFGYAGAIITTQKCELSQCAARTGGHMLNSHMERNTVIKADKIYPKFRSMGSLYRDGDKVIEGLQIVFDDKKIPIHKLNIN
jgi:hypothetical protein